MLFDKTPNPSEKKQTNKQNFSSVIWKSEY